MLLYVYDILLTRNFFDHRQHLILDLQAFLLRNLGQAKQFLGIQIEHIVAGLFLTQA